MADFSCKCAISAFTTSPELIETKDRAFQRSAVATTGFGEAMHARTPGAYSREWELPDGLLVELLEMGLSRRSRPLPLFAEDSYDAGGDGQGDTHGNADD